MVANRIAGAEVVVVLVDDVVLDDELVVVDTDVVEPGAVVEVVDVDEVEPGVVVEVVDVDEVVTGAVVDATDGCDGDEEQLGYATAKRTGRAKLKRRCDWATQHLPRGTRTL